LLRLPLFEDSDYPAIAFQEIIFLKKSKKMPRTNFQDLLDAGVHFGHLRRKWNPNMAPYIFMEKNGIHIIDLQKTIVKIDEAALAIKQIAKSGRKILFVATKKQAKDIVADLVGGVNMPYVTERWPGGMLTNFPTIRKAVKKMMSIDKMTKDNSWDVLSKREKLQISRQRAKLEKMLGSISDLTRLPAALFIVDVLKEKIAVREAQRLGIPVFAMVDTNSQPEGIDFVIPANDDASQSISLIVQTMTDAIREGLSERKVERDKDDDDTKETKVKSRKARVADEKSVAVESDDDAEDLDDEDLDEEIDE
jgi:small subunit ribosomal protein S2